MIPPQSAFTLSKNPVPRIPSSGVVLLRSQRETVQSPPQKERVQVEEVDVDEDTVLDVMLEDGIWREGGRYWLSCAFVSPGEVESARGCADVSVWWIVRRVRRRRVVGRAEG